MVIGDQVIGDRLSVASMSVPRSASAHAQLLAECCQLSANQWRLQNERSPAGFPTLQILRQT